jgi:uncharacterized repeat protein (TIGR01451 family)
MEELVRPTNTPFPTPTPIVDSGQPGNGGAFEPPATPQADDNSDNNDESSGDSGSTGGGSTGGGNTGGGNTSDESNSDNSESPPLTERTTPGTSLRGTVNVVTLNVRKGPSATDAIVDTLFRNEPVTILAQDSAGSWWYICCGSGSGREGWVSAALITPNFDQSAAATLPVTATSYDVTANVATAADQALLLEMRPSPAFVWQGQTVQLQFVVRNTSDQPLTNIRLRNDLPPTLTYLSTSTGQQGIVQATGQAKDGLIYTINWPEVAAGESLTATVTLQLAGTIPNGALVDNLAVVDTAEGANALAGITFAMPPLRLPRFR